MLSARRLLAAALTAVLAGPVLAVVPVPAASATPAGAAGSAAAPSRAAGRDLAVYYAGTDGLSGEDLAYRLHTIVDGHTRLSYAQLWEALPRTDPDPANGANLIDFYSGTPIPVSAQCGSGSCAGKWNREHTWAQSHGNLTTGAGPGTDLHHMRPSFADSNSSRGNLDFDDGGSTGVPSCAVCRRDGDSFEPRPEVKGDLARGLFYMTVRYDGGDGFADLALNDQTCNSSGAPNHGKLSTLVAWSLADPPDDRERARNELVDGTYQHNRNPFIDHPEWVTAIWGDGRGVGRACGSSSGPTYPTTPPPVTYAPPPSTLLVSEAYVDGGAVGSTYRDDFVELYNASTSTATLTRYTLQHRAPTAAGPAGAVFAFPSGAQVAPRSYAVVRLRGGSSGADLPRVDLDASASAVDPVGAGGTLYLSGSPTAVTPGDTSVGDTVGWGTSNAPESSAASGNGPTLSLQRFSSGSDTDRNAVDLAAATPTPGAGPPNRAPSTVATTAATTDEDTAVTVPLTATDPDGDPLTWQLTGGPGHGTATVAGSSLVYTPGQDYAGPDEVGLLVTDGRGGTATATVTLTVRPVDDRPVAAPVSAATPRDTPTTVALVGTDVEDPVLTYAVATGPAHGTVTIDGATATYTPATSYVGADSFTYTVRDSGGLVSAPATVSLTVTRRQEPPVATAVAVTTDEDQASTFALTATDPDGDPLTYAVAAGPQYGSVALAGSTATYTPQPDVHGTDTFTWSVSDGTASVTAAATITVRPVDDPPVAGDSAVTTAEDTSVAVVLEASDADGDPLQYAVTTGPRHGSVVLDGSVATYTPALDVHGTDTVVWTVSDGTATTRSTVTIRVTPVNDAPLAPPVAVTLPEDAPATAVDLVATDVDGDPLTYAVTGGPAHGNVSLAGNRASYTPAPGFHGSDGFTWAVSDGTVTTPGTATVTVTRVNHPPALAATTLRTTAGTPGTVTLAATDRDDDPLAVTEVSEPEHGTVSVDGLLLTYTPAERSSSEQLLVTVSDGQGGEVTARVGVQVVARTLQLRVSTSAATRGSRATTTVVAVAPPGAPPTGPVTLSAGGDTLGTGTFGPDGRATVTWTPPAAGVLSVVAAYAGDDLFAPARSAAVAVPVERSAARLTLTPVGALRRGRAGVLRARVATVGAVAPTGRVEVVAGARAVSARLSGGVATVRIARLPRTPRLRVVVRYVGDGQYAAASLTRTFVLRPGP